MKLTTFFLALTIENQAEGILDSERTFKINVRSCWTSFEISVTSAVTCI